MKDISMKDCKFFVNEEKRTVVCVIEGMKYQVYTDLDRTISAVGTSILLGEAMDTLLKNRFVGKAVCSAEDEWDENTGRLLAYSRAKNKFYHSYFKHLNHIMYNIDRELDEVQARFNEFGDQISKSFDQMQKTLEERIGTEKE